MHRRADLRGIQFVRDLLVLSNEEHPLHEEAEEAVRQGRKVSGHRPGSVATQPVGGARGRRSDLAQPGGQTRWAEGPEPIQEAGESPVVLAGRDGTRSGAAAGAAPLGRGLIRQNPALIRRELTTRKGDHSRHDEGAPRSGLREGEVESVAVGLHSGSVQAQLPQRDPAALQVEVQLERWSHRPPGAVPSSNDRERAICPCQRPASLHQPEKAARSPPERPDGGQLTVIEQGIGDRRRTQALAVHTEQDEAARGSPVVVLVPQDLDTGDQTPGAGTPT